MFKIKQFVLLLKIFQMKIYNLYSKQNLPISVDEAWALLSDPKNLQKITPPYMGFKILSGADRQCFLDKLFSTSLLQY